MVIKFPLKNDKSPAVKKGTDWRSYTGDVTTPMVGMVVPMGVIIIDLDLYKGVERSDVESVLGCQLNWDDALIQRTLNGGEHYAFRINEAEKLKQGANVLKVQGFDTRTQNNGYIATGEGYTDLTIFGVEEALTDIDDLPELPLSAVEALRDGVETEESDFMAMVSAETLELSNSEIEFYLDKLPDDVASDHDSWFKVGMAIYHQSGGSAQGWEWFDAFSKRCSDKYDQRANRKRWESFDSSSRSQPVTFATVIKMAGGRKIERELVTKEVSAGIEHAENLDDIKKELQRLADNKLDNLSLDVALKAIQNKYKIITGNTTSIPAIKKEIKALRGNDNTGDYIEDYVFLTATAEYCCRETKAVMGPRAFDVKHNRETPLNSDGEKQTACQFSNDKIEVVENTMYYPIADEIFTYNQLEYLNAYKPSNIKPVSVGKTNIVERVKGHIAHLLPDEIEQELVIQYLAHNVQYPGKKIQWAIVLQGVQGDGKSLLAEMMKHVMGNDNVRIMNVQTLESSFTGWATGQCMTFIEELKLDNFRKYEVLNNLKPYISNPMVEETKKGKDPRTVINTTNYFALTNFKDAIPIDENDRRYCVLFSQWQRKDKLAAWMVSNADYYPSLYEAMRENIGELLGWLLSVKITDEFKSMKRAPDTAAKIEMQELSKSPGMTDFEDAIEKYGELCEIEGGEINMTKLQKMVKEAQTFGDFEDFPSTRALKNTLLNLGYEYIGRKKIDGEKVTLYKK